MGLQNVHPAFRIRLRVASTLEVQKRGQCIRIGLRRSADSRLAVAASASWGTLSYDKRRLQPKGRLLANAAPVQRGFASKR